MPAFAINGKTLRIAAACAALALLTVALTWHDEERRGVWNETFQENIMSESFLRGELPEGMYNEPLYPAYMAAVLTTVHGVSGFTGEGLQDTFILTESARRRLGQANSILAAVIVAAVFAAAYAVSASLPLACAAGVLAMLLLPTPASSNPLTALLLLGHSVFALLAWRNPKIITAALAGLALGLLTLTEATFQYYLFIFPVIAAFGIWKSPTRRGPLTQAMAAAAFIALMTPVPWMARNARDVGQFAIVKGSEEIIGIRAEYGRAEWTEIRGAFAYYMPARNYPFAHEIRERAMRLLEPENFSYDRFDRDNPMGLYRRYKRRSGDVAALAESIHPGWKDLVQSRRYAIQMRYDDDWTRQDWLTIQNVKRQAALQLIRQDWLKHIALTFVFAERGADADRRALRTYGVPYAIDALESAAKFVKVTALPLAPAAILFFAWRRRDLSLALLALPMLYAFAAHAAATHFLPRYSSPYLPVLVVMLALSVREIQRIPRVRAAFARHSPFGARTGSR